MIAILVPVLGRGQLIDSLLNSIEEATDNPYRVVFICSPGDPATRVCLASDADTIVVPWQPGRGDFAKKINLAYRETDEDWMFQAATDVRFHPGWDANALTRAGGRYGVIGTNDLGNPLVKRGKHSTHTFFSRKYISTHGGTLDGTGEVFSEEYQHEYCDHELIEIAKVRNQFVFAHDSIVEHFHPAWGKAEMDDTYRKATDSTKEDRRLYQKRMRGVARTANKGRRRTTPARAEAMLARQEQLRKRSGL